MGLRIQNNVEAFNTHRQLDGDWRRRPRSRWRSSPAATASTAPLTTRPASPSAEKMRGQIGGLAQAQRNAQDGISLVQTAEGALTEVHSMLQRVRDLKVQFNNGTLSSDDQDAIASEVARSRTEIKQHRRADQVQQHRAARREHVHVPGRRERHARPSPRPPRASSARSAPPAPAASPSITAVSSAAAATTASTTGGTLAGISTIDDAIKNVSTRRADLGAVQNRLEHRLANLATYQENLTASESRIRDVDMASEMTKFTKLNILQQAGTSMLAQANQAPQGVLSLLR